MKIPKGIGTGMIPTPLRKLAADYCSTIHGMVYNAMKLFMEINPQLFDDCSHDYNELQNSADKREEARKAKWDRLGDQATKMKSGQGVPPISRPKIDADATQDSQQRLDALNLHDDSAAANPTSVSIYTS